MVKRNQSRQTLTPIGTCREVSTADIMVSSAKNNNLPRWKNVEIVTNVQSDGSIITAGLFDSIPTLYWLDLYKKAEIDRRHAAKIMDKLIEEKHFIKISKEQLRHYYPNVAKLATLNSKANEYLFITEEGWYRAIQEIGTGSMNNKEVAANIDAMKDEMASVFAKFKKGLLKFEEKPLRIGKIKEKREEGSVLTAQVKKWVTLLKVPEYTKRGLSARLAYSKEFTRLNEITAGKHESDLKNHLNTVGLDAHNLAKLTDCICFRIGITQDDTRWGHVENIVDDMYPDRLAQDLKLSTREQALLKRGCDENQQSLFDTFSAPKQLAGGMA